MYVRFASFVKGSTQKRWKCCPTAYTDGEQPVMCPFSAKDFSG